ncbi:hypothetical protein DXG03_001201 [Asterophora parasitica]|uniref:Uncharacterized protein n=1 Tax=Asterophora parasitica TaxID=117018 RepID=A0A9P7GA81_9AGAR|nr:hypothetical protein DXG03_001201 [Asterophora parasitica]
MKSVIVAATLGALAVSAHPAPEAEARGPSLSDSTILNFALTLEHLEDAFYKLGLSRFNQRSFDNAGLPAGAREQFVQISQHESEHVAFLTGLLGSKATKPCTYKFPINDPKSFSSLSQVFENVGVGAYTGATKSLSHQYITGSASILGTEARQAALVAAYVNGVEGWGNAFNVIRPFLFLIAIVTNHLQLQQIPLTLSQAYSLAAPFIVKCPSSNPKLPVTVFPTLTIPSSANPGDTVPVTFKSNVGRGKQLFAVFLFGLGQEVVPIRNGRVIIPKNLAGQVYALISTSSSGVTDRTTVAGPALLQFEFDLEGRYIPNS